MKRIGRVLVVAAGLTLSALAAQAQRVEVGAKIGLNYSSVAVTNAEGEVTSLSGLGAALFARLAPGRVGVQVEALYMRKGAAFEDPSGDDSGELRLNYYEIPVTLVVPFGGGPATGFAFAGPSLAFEASCELRFADTQSETTIDCDDPGTDVFERKTTDLGGVIGGGLRVGAGIGAFIFDARYTFGFSNLSDEPNADEESIRNRNFSVLIGYGITLGR
jgi:hypothetical protein